MRTEITVPFTFDTAPIEQKLQDIGANEVEGRVDELIRSHVDAVLPKSGGTWMEKPKPDWGQYLNDRMHTFFDEHSQEIIDEAAMLLAMRASRRKSWREVMVEYKEEKGE
jgi:siroheme synthase (precorrin-2 oxidase/ferrochelatase)